MQTQVYGCQRLNFNYMPGNFYNAVYIVWSSLSCVSDLSNLNYDYVHSNTKGNLQPEYEWTQQFTVQEVGKRRKHVMTNKLHTTSATLKIKHADRSLWLPAAKLLHARQFLQCCIVLSSLSCVSDFVKAKLWLCTFKHKRATYTLSMSKPSSHSAGSGKKEKTCDG